MGIGSCGIEAKKSYDLASLNWRSKISSGAIQS